jgi:septum site-determining protein MinD
MPAMKKPRPKHTKAKTKARQGRVLVVTSGKGGVGKTTSTAALAAALADRKSTRLNSSHK